MGGGSGGYLCNCVSDGQRFEMGGGGYLCDCVEMTRDLRWGEEATFVTVLR